VVDSFNIGRSSDRHLSGAFPVIDRFVDPHGFGIVARENLGQSALMPPKGISDAAMQLAAAAEQQTLVRSVADKRVLKGVSILALVHDQTGVSKASQSCV
jgi:hypothetical protein